MLPLVPINKETGEKLNLPYTEYGITVDIANDGIGYTLRGTNTLDGIEFDVYLSIPNKFDIEAGTYTRSGKIINGNSNVELVSGGEIQNGGVLEYKAYKSDFTFTETVEKGKSGNFVIRISKNATVNATVYFQIEKGSVAHDYEPYVGGKPSPSPEYPQEIKSVVNPTIKVCGKNLVPPRLKYRDTVKCYIKKGTKVTVVAKDGFVSGGGNIRFLDANGNEGWLGFDKGNKKQTIILSIDAYSFEFLLRGLESENVSLLIGDTGTYEPYKEQSIQLPITLNAVPVSSGGNVTIDGKQYIADYVDVERGKVVRMCYMYKFDIADYTSTLPDETMQDIRYVFTLRHTLKEQYSSIGLSNIGYKNYADIDSGDYPYGACITSANEARIRIKGVTNKTELTEYLANNNVFLLYSLLTPIEEELTTEQAQALKELSTYYPVTNIIVDSEQLYGYTAFNYPISMANGWNYVKQQLNDNRDYIYDMDLQSAEAYVNSEYAVALTELEVM